MNYPNSPTGALASEAFYRDVIAWGLENNVMIVNDAAHIQLTYGRKPLSLLSLPGALDSCLEVHTMSKGWDMIGWRMGFVAGAEIAVRAFARREGQYGFRTVQGDSKGSRRWRSMMRIFPGASANGMRGV